MSALIVKSVTKPGEELTDRDDVDDDVTVFMRDDARTTCAESAICDRWFRSVV